MDVDLLCNGEVRQTGEAGDELMAEINTEPVLVTKNAVCQCFVSGEFGSVQDDVFVNISECKFYSSSNVWVTYSTFCE